MWHCKIAHAPGEASCLQLIFDPLGFITPVLLEGKSILQDLCLQEVDWDDPISDEIKGRWEKWKAELLVLQQFSVLRCFKPDDFGLVVKKELHHFSDASSKGYGHSSYISLDSLFLCNWKVSCYPPSSLLLFPAWSSKPLWLL